LEDYELAENNVWAQVRVANVRLLNHGKFQRTRHSFKTPFDYAAGTIVEMWAMLDGIRVA